MFIVEMFVPTVVFAENVGEAGVVVVSISHGLTNVGSRRIFCVGPL